MKGVKYSAFGLAKGKDLKGDDFYAVTSNQTTTIAIVCDGVGGSDAGADAAKRVTNYLLNNFKNRPKAWSIEKSIKTFISSINTILYQESLLEYERAELLSTLAIVVVEGDRLYGANVGDSRVYIRRNGILTQLSNDHIQEQTSHILTQAIGASSSVELFYFENIVSTNDIILLCSDGLYNSLTKDFIEKNLHLGSHFLVKKASSISNDDLFDDTTAITIEIGKSSEITLLKQQNIEIAQNLKPNMFIDGYKLERSYNENTYLATKKNKTYILKFAPKEAIENEKILDLFVMEAWNAKRLKAPFLPIAVIPKNRTKRYYVMQYIAKENLKDRLDKHLLHIDDAIELAKTLLQMSQFLLKYDLVHGDIKPQNIILIEDAQKSKFKIIDFGSVSEIFSINSKSGTPSFLSPERFLNEAINESSEIFSIGVTLYYSLTRKYPYGEIEPFQNPQFKEAKKPSHYNQNIPPWLDSIILRCICIEKERRYSHYSEVIYELQNPQKVVPYFSKDISFIKHHEVLFYKSAFIVLGIINIILLILLNKN